MREPKEVSTLLSEVRKQYATVQAKIKEKLFYTNGNPDDPAIVAFMNEAYMALMGLSVQINTLEWILGNDNKTITEQINIFKDGSDA